MVGEKEVPEKKYPPEMNYSKVFKGLVGESLIDFSFHTVMAILLITGLIIDLLGPWVGGWISSVRSIIQGSVGSLFYGFVGALFILVFIVYFVYRAVLSRKTKTALPVINYVDLLFYIGLFITGIIGGHGFVGALFILVFIVYLIRIAYSKKMRMVLTATNYVDFLLYIGLIISGMTISSAHKPWVDLFPGLFDVLSPLAPYAPMLHVVITYVWIVFAIVFPGGILHGIATVYLVEHLKKKYRATKWRVK